MNIFETIAGHVPLKRLSHDDMKCKSSIFLHLSRPWIISVTLRLGKVGNQGASRHSRQLQIQCLRVT